MKIIDLEKLLPADVPAGERILWHGRPRAFGLARRAFRGDLVAVWFGLMVLWNGLSGVYDAGWQHGAIEAARTLATGIASLALVGLLGWLSARTTLYVVTSRRVVLKAGIALPVFFNIPFAEIVAADLRVHADGTGDIALGLTPGRRIAYLHLWPHAKPFVFRAPRPMLRCIAHPGAVADQLARALAVAPAGPAETMPRPANAATGDLVAA